MKNLFNIIKERSGDYSSVRVVVLLTFALLCVMYYHWLEAFKIEIQREQPDYSGLTQLFVAMFVTFGLALFAKVWQKKHEK